MRHDRTRNRCARGGLTPFLLGLLLGAAVGGVAGLLLAPRSGAESRYLLSENLNSRREGARKVVAETRHEAQKRQGDLISRLQFYWRRFGEALQAGKQAALEKHQQLQQDQEGGKP